MENKLGKLRVKGPPTELRERVLAAASAEMRRSHYLSERVWRSRIFWLSAAAAVIFGLAVPTIFSTRSIPSMAALKITLEARSTAKEISKMAGDGAALEEQFAIQLSGPIAMAGGEKTDIKEWLERRL